MLMLTRRVGESLVIDDEIKVIIIGSSGANIRVGIEAPKKMTIMRSELLNREPVQRRLSKHMIIDRAHEAIGRLVELKPELADLAIDDWTVRDLLDILDTRYENG